VSVNFVLIKVLAGFYIQRFKSSLVTSPVLYPVIILALRCFSSNFLDETRQNLEFNGLLTVFSFLRLQYFTVCTTDVNQACGSLLLSSVVLSEQRGLATHHGLYVFSDDAMK
jgi:hypothetical protein